MLNSFRTKNSSNCEEEAKFIQDRINHAEKNISELCYTFGQYTRKAARIRDKNDELARVTLAYVTNENINKSLTNGLENFADSLSILADYGDLRVQTLDSKVVCQFSKYEDICKRAKEEVKEIFIAREKEVIRKKQLDRIRDRNPRNRHQIIQAETEYVKATAELSKTVHSIEEKTNTFEKQKLHDMKSILLDFISTEMGYHAKALEILTKAYNHIDAIDEDLDLKDFHNTRDKMDLEFKKSLRLSDKIHHQQSGSKSSLFRSSQSLGSLGMIFSTTHREKRPGITSAKSKDSVRNVNKSQDTLDSLKHHESATESDTHDYSSDNESR